MLVKVCGKQFSLRSVHHPVKKPPPKRVGRVELYHKSWNVTCCYMQLILGKVSIFKSTTLTVTGSLTAWIWNVVIYTGDPQLQPNSLSEALGSFLPG
jgi:hypothetical protein